MNKIDSRFGEIEYAPESVLSFPEGLIGFEQLRQFVVMPNEKEGPLFWIQSVEDPQVALVLTDPTNFFPTYAILPDESERNILGIDENDQFFVLVVVTVSAQREITMNLAAPILFAPETNKAIQIILENSDYDIRTPLPVVKTAAAKAE